MNSGRGSPEVAIGVDLGGTKIEAVVARNGARDVVVRRRVPTPQAEGYEAIVAATRAIVLDVASEAGVNVVVTPIGVGMPGSVTRREGFVKNSNTVCLNGRPFRSDLESALGRPVAFENDANCFTLAEATLGAAAAHRHGIVFGVILGTGVGGGISAFGTIWSGASGIAGEWGHHAVFEGAGPGCYCGKRGCLETFASGPAVEADYARRSGVRFKLAEIAERKNEDEHAWGAIDLFLRAYGRGLANVIDILDPSAVVLGGGVSNLALLYDEGRKHVEACVFNDELVTPIVKNALGDSAGVLGAALVAR